MKIKVTIDAEDLSKLIASKFNNPDSLVIKYKDVITGVPTEIVAECEWDDEIIKYY